MNKCLTSLSIVFSVFIISCDQNQTQAVVDSSCEPSQERCNDNAIETCNTLGEWETVVCPVDHACFDHEGFPRCQPMVEDTSDQLDAYINDDRLDMNPQNELDEESQSDMNDGDDDQIDDACLLVQPDTLDFGDVLLGERSGDQWIDIQNCGNTPITINEITFGQNGEDFSSTFEGSLPIFLAPNTEFRLSVYYINTTLVDGESIQSTLLITTDISENPSWEVPLRVAGETSCELSIIPEHLNFGSLTQGQSITRSLQIINRGTGSCQIISQSIESPLSVLGDDSIPFTLSQPIMTDSISHGDINSFEITYSPMSIAEDFAIYKLTYYDPVSNQNKEVSVFLVGASEELTIEVYPNQVRFGRVLHECASREKTISFYNTGVVSLCYANIRLEGECQEFSIKNSTIADTEGCIEAIYSTPATVTLVYEPEDLGVDECELVFNSDSMEYPEIRIPLSGEGIPLRRSIDEFVQSGGEKVDILFIVDNSGSMSEEQDNLDRNFTEFITQALEFQNDYHIGIITTDMDNDTDSGQLRAPGVITRGPNIVDEFGDTIRVGTNGSNLEKGLAAAYTALSQPLLYDTGILCTTNSDCQAPTLCIDSKCGGFNRGFVREDASLELIFVSDEDDASSESPSFYANFFKSIKGILNESRFHAHAIVGALDGDPSACDGANGEASPGDRYIEVAQSTNGQVHSICESDFGLALREIGREAFDLPIQFSLSYPAEATSISVEIDAQPQNDGWRYDYESNSIIFTESSVPQINQTIQIHYSVECLPRAEY